MVKSALSLVTLATLLFTVVACSDPPSTFENGKAPENGPGTDPGTFEPTGDITDGTPTDTTASCKVVQLTTFKPVWNTPHSVQPTACAKADLDLYATACLALPLDKAKCDAFAAAHPACASCVQAEATAPSQAVVQWRAKNAYTLNVAGCIGLTQKDLGDKSCGATYDAAIECRRQSCDACLAGEAPASFEQYSSCQKEAGKTGVCDSWARVQRNTCGDISSEGKATAVCFAQAGESTRDVFKRIAGVFCGGK